jgi:hypothetical protein
MAGHLPGVSELGTENPKEKKEEDRLQEFSRSPGGYL